MKLSILDQSPISSGSSAFDALQTSIRLAQLGEELGYERYWIAEHHDLYGLACSNPDVMLGVIGSHTKTIKIGAGAVLLPYYKPFRVAETYNLLATLFPGRIDLGLGRAPGGSAEVSLALADNFLKQVTEFPERIEQLINFLYHRFPEDEHFGKIEPKPVPDEPPQLWLLGTSQKSSLLAAEKGLAYAFGHFMSKIDGPTAVKTYRETFNPDVRTEPYTIVAVNVICAETSEEAHSLVKSALAWKLLQEKNATELTVPSIDEVNRFVWTSEEKARMEQAKEKIIIGNPKEVKAQLLALQAAYEADEMMVVTIVHDENAKFQSYRLLANHFSNEETNL